LKNVSNGCELSNSGSSSITGIDATVVVGKGAYVLPNNVSFVNDATMEYDGQEHTITVS